MTKLIDDTKKYVENLLTNRLNTGHFYHNLSHTKLVVECATEIANMSKISDENRELILIAAWFHDTGYIIKYNSNEIYAANIALDFLKPYSLSKEQLSIIESCILVTKVPQKPKNLLEKIICDADLGNLASEKFFEITLNLKEETEFFKKTKISDKKWYQQTIDFMDLHQYHTDYAIKYYTAKKAYNRNKLVEMIKD